MALIKGFHPDGPLANGNVLITGRGRQINLSPTRSADPSAEPMQGAVDQIEAALKAKDDRYIAERKARENSASPSPESTTSANDKRK